MQKTKRLLKQNEQAADPVFIIVDLFCGAGGTTQGFVESVLPTDIYSKYYVGPDFCKTGFHKIAKVIACVNHDPKAIKSHWRNHPEVKHFEEDIRTLDLTELKKLVKFYRKKYPKAYLILWASLECTNFSKAKGGQPREADSRTLAEHLHRYVTALQPDFIQIENVVEFMSWGPLDENGKPVSRKNGRDWLKWREEMCAHGYVDDWREMNSANYGAYTSRNRLFGVFARPWLPISFPVPTHAKHPEKHGMYEGLDKWKAVKDVLNFKDQGESIFTRNKPLSDNTLERIFAGLVKYVAKGDKAFISKYFSGRPKGKVNSIDFPAATITTFGGSTLVQPVSLLKYNSTNGKTKKHVPPSLDEPAPVISTWGGLGVVQTEFLDVIYGNGYPTSIEGPAPVLRCKDGLAKVRPEFFIDKHFGKSSQNQSIHQPAGSILPNDKHRLVGVIPFIMPTSYKNKPKSVNEPAPPILASRKHHYVTFIENPSHGGHCTSTDAPCPVIVARQDKAPLRMITTNAAAEDGEQIFVCVYEHDTEAMIKIKKFMAMYKIVDIKMRMLRVPELLDIQGFPKGYKLEGNQSDQKKFIGNSVVPHVVKSWTEAMAAGLIELEERQMAI